jgi:hypothetical protein
MYVGSVVVGVMVVVTVVVIVDAAVYLSDQ